MATLKGLGCPGLRKAMNGVVRQAEWKPAPSCPSSGRRMTGLSLELRQ